MEKDSVIEIMKEVEKYMGSLPEELRELLERVRETIRAAAPENEEKMSYGVPAFAIEGENVVLYAAF